MTTAHPHIPEDDLALFALALMPPEEAAYTQAHLKHCDQCRAEVARMQGDLVGLAFTADLHDPPAAARTRLLDAVAHEKKLHIPAAAEPVLAPRTSILADKRSARATREPAGTRAGFGPFSWLGWAIAACALAVVGWQYQQRHVLIASHAVEINDLQAKLVQQTAATQQTAAQAAQNAQTAQQNATVAQQKTQEAQQNASVAQRNATLAEQNATAAQQSEAQARAATQQAQLTAQQAQLTEAEAARAREVLELLTNPAALQVSLQLTPAGKTPPKPQGHASYDPSRGQLVFVASHLKPVAPGKTYELWILPTAPGAAPVAAGLFRPDINGNASVVLPSIPRNVAAKGFGVTVENAGGSTSPTLPIVLAG